MDVFTDKKRSAIMRAVQHKNTKPELIVRRLTHGLGYRYRLHRTDLPGKPDLTFIGRKKVIFVHGCFWHGHDCKRGARIPKSNTAYWLGKIEKNRTRDFSHKQELESQGWKVLIIWECEIKDLRALSGKIDNFLSGG